MALPAKREGKAGDFSLFFDYRDERFIRPRAIPQKSGIASKRPMGSWSLSSMILAGLVLPALFAMVEEEEEGGGGGEIFL